MLKHDVSYVLILTGALIQYSGDDLNKFLWMIRISSGVWPDEIRETDYYNSRGEFRVDETASKAMRESIMYKMSYYRSAQYSLARRRCGSTDMGSIQASRTFSPPDRRKTVCGTRRSRRRDWT